MIKEIIKSNLERIEHDLSEIEGLESIDFIDIFPKNEKHRNQLDEEAMKLSKLIKETERGNIYLLNTPIETKYGNLSLFKVRYYDKSRLNWEAAADFAVKDRNILMQKVGKDNRFTYTVRPDWDAVEFKTDNTLIYFLNPLASEVYLLGKE